MADKTSNLQTLRVAGFGGVGISAVALGAAFAFTGAFAAIPLGIYVALVALPPVALAVGLHTGVIGGFAGAIKGFTQKPKAIGGTAWAGAKKGLAYGFAAAMTILSIGSIVVATGAALNPTGFQKEVSKVTRLNLASAEIAPHKIVVADNGPAKVAVIRQASAPAAKPTL